MNSYQDPASPYQAPPTMGNVRYYVMLPGFEGTAYTVAELQAMALSKVIKPNTQVQPEGQDYALMANDVPGLYSEKSWLVALLLSFFLGPLGIDRFYLGRIGLGVLKLLVTLVTFGLGGFVWWIVDIVLIANRNIKTGDGLPLGA